MKTILKWISKRIIKLQTEYDDLNTESELQKKISKGIKLTGFKETKEYIISHDLIKDDMRTHVEEAVEKFRLSENDLLGNEWNNIYFKVKDDTEKVKNIVYQDLNNEDLLRYLLYLTKQQDSAIDERIRNL